MTRHSEYPAPTSLISDLLDQQSEAEPGFYSDELRALIDELPEPRRTLVQARFFERMSYTQAGELFGKGKGWARYNTGVALRKLKEKIADGVLD